MNPTDLNARLHAKAVHVANHLDALTPYERALVLHQAEIIWAERRHGGPDPADAETDEALIGGQYLSNVVQRLSPEDREELVELAKRLDKEGRWDRMMRDSTV